MVVTPDTILLRCPSQNLSYRHNVLEGVRLQLLAWTLPLSDFQPLPGPLQVRFQLFGPFLLGTSPLLLPHGPLPFHISPFAFRFCPLPRRVRYFPLR
jgi:hypothetical protein